MSSPHAGPQPERRDDPSTAPTVIVTVVFVIVFVVTLLGLQAYFGRATSEQEQAKVVAPASQALEAVRAQQRAQLAGYREVAPDSGIVAIPIERAMELVAAEIAARAARPDSLPAAAED